MIVWCLLWAKRYIWRGKDNKHHSLPFIWCYHGCCWSRCCCSICHHMCARVTMCEIGCEWQCSCMDVDVYFDPSWASYIVPYRNELVYQVSKYFIFNILNICFIVIMIKQSIYNANIKWQFNSFRIENNIMALMPCSNNDDTHQRWLNVYGIDTVYEK